MNEWLLPLLTGLVLYSVLLATTMYMSSLCVFLRFKPSSSFLGPAELVFHLLQSSQSIILLIYWSIVANKWEKLMGEGSWSLRQWGGKTEGARANGYDNMLSCGWNGCDQPSVIGRRDCNSFRGAFRGKEKLELLSCSCMPHICGVYTRLGLNWYIWFKWVISSEKHAVYT